MESDLGKLFIGGISWDTNEERLREYFMNYGEVVEAVIMKDRTTGRARGFGFVVFADPAVAERVLMEKHTIDGRMVEAKKAVPRDDQHILNRNSGSFGTITDAVVMYDHNTQRPRGFGFITYDSEDAVDKALVKTFHELNGYNPSSIGGYGMRMDARFGPIASGRSGFSPFSPAGYGMARSLWGNGGLNYATNSANANAFIGSGSGNPGGFGNNTINWAASASSISTQDGGNNAGHASGRLGYASSENSLGLGGGSYARSSSTGTGPNTSYSGTNGYEGAYADLYSGSSIYGDPTWRSVSSEVDGSGPFGYGLGNAASDVRAKGLVSALDAAKNLFSNLLSKQTTCGSVADRFILLFTLADRHQELLPRELIMPIPEHMLVEGIG
ncbi:hypothetical protein Taro_043257 [Colocasia esculenta]|uniref:RRM domain-containing protein n=1 Tax=Colocasia esculenta TaxID=4460 RepID=A0A843WFY3_COLES|nr:hypothetical protein [Colocasia esculenta]